MHDPTQRKLTPIWGQQVWERWRWNWCFELFDKRGNVLRYGQGFPIRQEAEVAVNKARREYEGRS